MRYFEGKDPNCPDAWGEKFNFIDENNVVLGFDSSQDCCEHASWYVADHPVLSSEGQDEQGFTDWEGFVFDPDFFVEAESLTSFDEGGVAVFRIIRTPKRERWNRQVKYLHIFNAHNGYYGHGFTFKVGDETKREGGL